MENILMMHGGAPTAVINASLYGSIKELKDANFKGKILASRFGTGGLLKRDILDLSSASDNSLNALLHTPGSAIGTGRDHLEAEDYITLASNLVDLNVKYVLLTGGNGSMDTTYKLAQACKEKGIIVCGVPKTMDNDLEPCDHSPGFASAARYLAASVREVAEDVKGLPIHVVIVESFGRDAGYLAASSALAREEGAGPDMVLLPEVPFEEERFLERVLALHKEKGGVVVVASEGLRYKDGKPIVKPVFQKERSTYFGDVSSHLSTLVISKLGIKARSEKPGILGRASIAWQSERDVDDAIKAGREAVRLALDGKSGYMSTVTRDGISSTIIRKEILKERVLSDKYIDRDNFDIKSDYLTWLKPLVGSLGSPFVSFT